MNSKHSKPLGFVKAIKHIAVSLLMLWGTAANAVPVQVDFTADLAPILSPIVGSNPGSGVVSGTLGIFSPGGPGSLFVVPTDGSLIASVSGFVAGFPNGDIPLTTLFGGSPFNFLFSATGPTSEDFAGSFVGGGFLQSDGLPCTIGGNNTACFVSFSAENIGDDLAIVSFFGAGEAPPSSLGPLEFSFTVVNEPPVAVPLPAIAPLTASLFGALMLLARRRRTPCAK